jgi:hypothetical protein
MLIEVKVTGTVVLVKKYDCNKREEGEKMGESEDASIDQSYSINDSNKNNNQPKQ